MKLNATKRNFNCKPKHYFSPDLTGTAISGIKNDKSTSKTGCHKLRKFLSSLTLKRTKISICGEQFDNDTSSSELRAYFELSGYNFSEIKIVLELSNEDHTVHSNSNNCHLNHEVQSFIQKHVICYLSQAEGTLAAKTSIQKSTYSILLRIIEQMVEKSEARQYIKRFVSIVDTPNGSFIIVLKRDLPCFGCQNYKQLYVFKICGDIVQILLDQFYQTQHEYFFTSDAAAIHHSFWSHGLDWTQFNVKIMSFGTSRVYLISPHVELFISSHNFTDSDTDSNHSDLEVISLDSDSSRGSGGVSILRPSTDDYFVIKINNDPGGGQMEVNSVSAVSTQFHRHKLPFYAIGYFVHSTENVVFRGLFPGGSFKGFTGLSKLNHLIKLSSLDACCDLKPTQFVSVLFMHLGRSRPHIESDIVRFDNRKCMSDCVQQTLRFNSAAGIYHSDYRRDNFMFFPKLQSWFVIDYDLSFSSDVQHVELMKGSPRANACGGRVKNKLSNMNLQNGQSLVVEDWGVCDECEMVMEFCMNVN